jgi:hypothetical protein
VILQYLQLWEIVQGVVTMPGVPDAVVWRWSSNRRYSAASAYGAMFIGAAAPFGASLIWNSRAPPKVRFFFWLALHGRCWTAKTTTLASCVYSLLKLWTTSSSAASSVDKFGFICCPGLT